MLDAHMRVVPDVSLVVENEGCVECVPVDREGEDSNQNDRGKTHDAG